MATLINKIRFGSLLDSLADHLPASSSGAGTVLSDGSRDLSGAQVIAHVSGFAEKLKFLAASRVALIAENGIDWIIADLACQCAGVTLLPVPSFFSPAQVAHVLEETGIDLLLFQEEALSLESLLPKARETWRQQQGGLGALTLYRRLGSPPRAPAQLPEGTGKITYTSGSTAAPKGVCLGNAQLLRQAAALAEAVAVPGNRHLCLLPLSVLLENIAGVYCTLVNGGSVIAPPLSTLGVTGSSSLAVDKLLAAISHHQPETMILLPQLLAALVQCCENGWRPPGSLRFVAVGGSKVSGGLIRRARRFGIPVYEGYGLSECASVVSLNTPAHDRPGSVGKPLSHLDVSIEEGEVVIAGNPFLGYVNAPSSWYQAEVRSGDLGELERDGFLQLRGRKKNLLISSFGRNISPEWVESELCGSPLVREAVVFGDGKPWLCALILPHHSGIGEREIDHWINTANNGLPDYARIRRWVRLAQPLASLPGLTTATGKPKREAIYRHFEHAIDNLYDYPEVASL